MAAMQPSDTHANSNDRSVVVLKTSDVTIRGNEVLMPILIEMSQIKKPEREQFKKVEITREMTERDVTGKLLETFPYLRNQRFYCAAAADGRTRLDFNGDRRIWNGRLIKRLLKGNSALYIFVDEQVPGCANMAPQSEASSRTAVATATQNRVDLDATLVSSSHSLPMGSSGHKETQPAQGPFCALSVRYSPNTLQPIQPMETDAHGVNQDLNSSASGRRWASSDKIAVSPQGPILDDLLESSNLCWRENDSSDSEIDFSNLIALSEMDDSELTTLLSPSGVDSSLTSQASNNVGLHSQKNQRHNTIQMPGPLHAMQTQVSHVMRGNNSDSGLGSQSSSSAPQSRHTSDMENSALEEYPAIIKIRPNAVGLSGAPSCEFLGLAELFPEVQSGYATVGNLEKEILWKKGDKHGNGNCIPPSPKPGKQIVKIYSVTGRKLVEAELWYMDPCHHTDDECLVRVGEKASQSYEELCIVLSNILIRCRPHASIKSGESQYSGNSESSLIVQVLRFLINEAAESGLQWDSLALLEFVAMNHDHENAALFLEEGTERYARDITPEGRERIDLSELLAAINASHEEDEASDISDGGNDSDSSYDGDVESLLCDSEEPTSDSEDDHSDMLRKAFATGNEIQMGGNNAETDERVILNLPSGYLSGAQIGEKGVWPYLSKVTLPSMVPDFIGRQGECEEIIQDLTSKSVQIVTISGSAGIGKTSLAIAVGHSLRSQGCPVCYTSLRRVYSKDDLISEFLSVLRQPNINGQPFHQSVSLDDKLRQMVSLIGNRSLLILDDADELFDGGSSKVKEEVALLFEELMQNQGVAFLLISRKPLEYLNNRFEGHRDFRIGPLDETSAQSLLYRLLPDTTAADCAQISRACGQVPLALQLMCSLIRESSTQPRQILDDVLKSSIEDMEKIMNNPEYVPSCQIPFESYIESSYKSLSKQEQEALICLSLLSASFSTEEAVAELDLKEGFKAKEILQSLRSKSLIDFSPKHQSFTMHKVIQTFARKKKEEVFETNPHSKVRLTFDSPTKLMREEHKSTKDCNFSLVIPQSAINDFPATPLSHQRAQEILEFHQRALELFAEKNASTADYYYSLGNTQNKMNDLSSALKSQQHALDIRLQLYGDNHASSADSYYSLGNTQFKLKDFTSALESHKRALRIRLDLFGEKYASTADSYYSLGNTQYQMNDFTSALESHERALDIRLNLFGREHAGTADSYFSLGITQYEMGDFPLSQQSHQHALNIRLNLFGEDHARTADSYRELGLTSAHLYAFNSIVQRRQCPLAIFLKLHSVLEKNKQAEFRSKRSE